MPRFKLKHQEWAVVCDGKKALILCNVEDDAFPQLKLVEEHEHEDKRTHDLGTSPPPRVHESTGFGRSAIEQTDFHRAAEQKFLETLVKRVDGAVREGKVKHLIFVAPPGVLGIIRPMYTPALRAALKEEIAKDWVKMPVSEIEKRLGAD
ncbi:MAG TPA: host attachment protein [Xanthobacteraceae bacterium]|jgi:protein required for attachment to host cells|nr:host attachment protein [Xanthobacteraceae bacterium]